jgi:hypothetical protein
MLGEEEKRFGGKQQDSRPGIGSANGFVTVWAIESPGATGRMARREDARSPVEWTQQSRKDCQGGGEVPMPALPNEGETLDRDLDRPAPTGVALDLEPIRAAIKGIRFGEVRIVIQDGVVIQIDRMEKRRIR